MFYEKVNNIAGMELTRKMAKKYINDPRSSCNNNVLLVNSFFPNSNDLAWSVDDSILIISNNNDSEFVRTAVLLMKMRLFTVINIDFILIINYYIFFGF